MAALEPRGARQQGVSECDVRRSLMGGVRCTMKFAFVTIIAFFLSLLCQRIAIKIRRLHPWHIKLIYEAHISAGLIRPY